MHDLLISAINLKEAPLLALTPLLCLDAKGKTEEGRRRRRAEEKRRERGKEVQVQVQGSPQGTQGRSSILTGKKSCPPERLNETRIKLKSTFWQCHREGILATKGKDRISSVTKSINDSSGNHCVLTSG